MVTRQDVVEEALTWLGTPWQHNQRCKGAGVDCAQFIGGVGENLGLLSQSQLQSIPAYSMQWQLHRTEQKFIKTLLYLGFVETTTFLLGDVMTFTYARAMSHASIYIGEGKIIHAPREGLAKVCIARLDFELKRRLGKTLSFPGIL